MPGSGIVVTLVKENTRSLKSASPSLAGDVLEAHDGGALQPRKQLGTSTRQPERPAAVFHVAASVMIACGLPSRLLAAGPV